jgi:hypothetical protein
VSEFEDLFAEWASFTVAVKTHTGDGPKGPIYTDQTVEGVLVEETAVLVTDSTGNQRQSTTTLYVPVEKADAFKPESVVTIGGRVARVITLSKYVVVGFPQSAVVYCV